MYVPLAVNMRILKPNRTGLAQAVRVLRRGGVIVYPTDTAYGLGGVFDSPAVTRKILRIKNRTDKKFTLVASSRRQVERFFPLHPLQKKLAGHYWPGPLSLVVSRRFAVRVPAHPVARTLCRRAGRPLIASSANRSGQPSPYRVTTVVAQFRNQKDQPELIIDAGPLPRRKSSTVVAIRAGRLKRQPTSTMVAVKRHQLVIIRSGRLTPHLIRW